MARNLSRCNPWTNHYSTSTLSDIKSALFDGDYDSARGLAAFGTTEDANPFCVELLEDAIKLASKGCEPNIETFFYGEME